jgi:hypothetical protein
VNVAGKLAHIPHILQVNPHRVINFVCGIFPHSWQIVAVRVKGDENFEMA